MDRFGNLKSLRGKRILVVDDEPDIRKMISDAFAEQGAVVMSAASGDEGFEIAETSAVDVIISDRRMPSGDGIALFDRISNLHGAAPYFVLISACAQTPPPELYERGVGAIFSKPFSIAGLVENVQQALVPAHERWVRPLDVSLVDSLYVNPEPPDFTVTGQQFRFGRQGLFISTVNPVSENSFVAFDICTEDGRTFRGVGICRFAQVNSESCADGIGIEFHSLTEDSYHILVEYLKLAQPRATIPKNCGWFKSS